MASNKELMAVHASTARDIRRSKFELDIRKSAIQGCTYAHDPDKCYKDTVASTMASYDLEVARYEAEIPATAPAKKPVAKK
jgi:hypothetical protein